MVILLNLLIAIISDTYANVVSQKFLANNFEKATILKDISINMVGFQRNRLKKKGFLKKYIIFASFKKEDDEENQECNEIKEKVEVIESKISDMSNNFNNLNVKINNIEEMLREFSQNFKISKK